MEAKFYLHKGNKNKYEGNTKHPIRIHFSYAGKTFKRGIGRMGHEGIDPKTKKPYFHSTTGPLGNTQKNNEVRQRMAECARAIQKAYTRYKQDAALPGSTLPPEPTTEVLGLYYDEELGIAPAEGTGASHGAIKANVQALLQYWLDNYSKKGVEVYQYSFNSLMTFMGHHCKTLELSELTLSFWEKYKQWLVTPEDVARDPFHEKGYGVTNVSANHYLNNLRTMISQTLKLEQFRALLIPSAYKEFEFLPQLARKKKRGMSEMELYLFCHTYYYERKEGKKKVIECDTVIPGAPTCSLPLDGTYKLYSPFMRSRDAYIFCCATPVRISDYFRLDPDNFIDSHDQQRNTIKVLDIYQKKTSRRLQIPISDHNLSLMEQYEQSTGRPLPKINHKDVNIHLKKMLKLAGFMNYIVEVPTMIGTEIVKEKKFKWQTISIHTARNTFATHALDNNTPAVHVRDAMGHANLATTLQYESSEQERVNTSILNFVNRKPPVELAN